jgi:hypothetical protein
MITQRVSMYSTIFKSKQLKSIIILSLAFIISMPILLSNNVTAQTSSFYEKSFAWDYGGNHWTWNLSIPKALYNAYQEVSVERRTHDGPAGYGFLTTTEDYYVKVLAKRLDKITTEQGYDAYDKVSFVLAFVQSLPYTSDSVTTDRDEYPRFPIETLVDDGGDCEDTSVLFATLTLIMGYATVYINPPDHYAVGVLGQNLRGTYWTYPADSNDTYYYCETTGDGFKIGQLPTEFQGQDAYIYSIDESKQFVPETVVVPTAEPTSTKSPIIGSTTPPPTSSPVVTDPQLQPVLPLSFNLISENPVLFILIVFAIVASMVMTIWSVRQPRKHATVKPSPASIVSEVTQEPDLGTSKLCSHCGSTNKDYAAFCQDCGKQIG